ncbi:MAG: hypothetical protein JWO19_5862 [Bryobacterales bacterium]|nr:hypothetical protein [Bryobacterales bacterium]
MSSRVWQFGLWKTKLGTPRTRYDVLRCALIIFDEHFPPDDADDALAVRYLGGKISVSRKGDDLSKNGRRPVNGVLARLFYARKFTAQPVFCELSVQVLMKIKSGQCRYARTKDAVMPAKLAHLVVMLNYQAPRLYPHLGFSVTGNASSLIGWSRKFDEPIPLPPCGKGVRQGRQLVTLKDAGTYITKLSKAEHMAPEWQAATEALMLVATLPRSGARCGPTMFVRIGITRALNRHVPREAGQRVFDPIAQRDALGSAEARPRPLNFLKSVDFLLDGLSGK